ncbi:MAG: DUF1934 domain-containing protein [Clostridia bacterium]|nr:DUF1934 domain-containing protein [Clostridia bacterium]
MKQNATIFVKGVQSVDGERDTIELSSEGTVETTPTGLRLSYNELDESGEMIETVVTVVGETVKIDRCGANEMSMIVQKGKHRKCTYNTPMGALLIGTYGTLFLQGSHSLKLKYDLDMSAVLMSRNELEIQYTLDGSTEQ